MLHQLFFFAFYLPLLLTVFKSPFAGVLLYHWLDNLPPGETYSVDLVSGYLSLIAGALTFFMWLIQEKKTVPRPLLVTLIMIGLLLWVNLTSLYALVPSQVAFEWYRTVKVIGFAILTAQMLTTRARQEAYVWVLVLCATYFALPGAIKLILSGGSGGIGEGEVVVAETGSFFGDRVTLSVVLAMSLPFALYLGRRATLLPARWLGWVKPAMLGTAISFLLALIGTFARTGLLAGGATLLMLAVRSQRKIVAVLIIVIVALVLLAIAPQNWFDRMDSIIYYQSDDSAVSRIAAWKWSWQMALNHPIVGGGFGVFVLDAGSIPGRPGWLEAHNIFFQMMAEHGFVGLALFCGLIIAIYRSCAVVQKKARGREELAWAADLARSTQIGLVAFTAGGMFVSIATTPFLYMLAAIIVGTRSFVERELAASAARTRHLARARAVALPAS